MKPLICITWIPPVYTWIQAEKLYLTQELLWPWVHNPCCAAGRCAVGWVCQQYVPPDFGHSRLPSVNSISARYLRDFSRGRHSDRPVDIFRAKPNMGCCYCGKVQVIMSSCFRKSVNGEVWKPLSCKLSHQRCPGYRWKCVALRQYSTFLIAPSVSI